jgi:superfamily II DNA or RNA helicase
MRPSQKLIRRLTLADLKNKTLSELKIKEKHQVDCKRILSAIHTFEIEFVYNALEEHTIFILTPPLYSYHWSSSFFDSYNESIGIIIKDSGQLDYLSANNEGDNYKMLCLLYAFFSKSFPVEKGVDRLNIISDCLLWRYGLADLPKPNIESFYFHHPLKGLKPNDPNDKVNTETKKKNYPIVNHTFFTNLDSLFTKENGFLDQPKIFIYKSLALEHTYLIFSNGKAISLKNFLFSPYSWLYPDMLEVLLGTFSEAREKIDARWDFAPYESDWDGQFYYIDKLNTFLSQSSLHNKPKYVGPTQKGSHLEAHKAIEVESMEILPPNEFNTDYSLKDDGRICIDIQVIQKPTLGLKEFSTFYYDEKCKKIYLRNIQTLNKELNYHLYRMFSLKEHPGDDDQQSKSIEILNYPDPLKVQTIVQKYFSNFAFRELANLKVVTAQLSIDFKKNQMDQADAFIHWPISSEDSISNPSLVNNSLTLITTHARYLTDASSHLLDLLDGIEGGIAGVLGQESRYLAKKDHQRRANELKFYKHQGLFLLMITESILLWPSLNTEKKFTDYISEQCLKFILNLVGVQDINDKKFKSSLIEPYVTKSFIRNLRKVIKTIYLVFNDSFCYVENGQCYKVNLGSVHSQILSWLTTCKLKSASSRQRYLKGRYPMIHVARTNIAPKQPKIVPEQNDLSHIVLRLVSKESFAIQDAYSAAAVSIDGKPVEQLSLDDIRSEINIQGAKRIDWFELHPKYFFKGIEVNQNLVGDFLSGKIIEHDGAFYRISEKAIPSLTWLNQFWDRISDGSNKKNLDLTTEKMQVQLNTHHVLQLLALKKLGTIIHGDEKWEEISKNFDEIDQLQEKHKPLIKKSLKTFDGQLKDFQLDGLQWLLQLHSLGFGGILADDMGLGKTVQSIAFLNHLNTHKSLGPTLIIAPTSLVFNWENELDRFCPQLDFSVFDPQTFDKSAPIRDGQILICTYGLLVEHQDYFHKHKWNVSIFDEAQNIKNIKSKRAQVCRQLVSDYKIGLSGTPMENNFSELYSVIDLAIPGALGPYDHFVKQYQVSDADNNSSSLNFLKQTIKPFVLRRSKQLVLKDLPDKTESVVRLPFEKSQEKIYKSLALSWNDQVSDLIAKQGESKSQLQMLTALLRLRQVCSCPQSVPNIKYQKVPPKIDLIAEKVAQLVNKKESVIIFSSFLFTIDYLQQILKDKGITTLTMSGRDSQKVRKDTLTRFNKEGKASVLLMTLKTGGVGLNLTKANYVFHIEPWWNPAAENQGTDRVHRMGQKRSVNVYRYIIKDSVEDKIQLLKKQKMAAFDSLFSLNDDDLGLPENVKLNSSKISMEDFQWLLS